MQRAALFTALMLLPACGATSVARGPVVVTSDGRVIETPLVDEPQQTDVPKRDANTTGTWVGVAAESDVLLAHDGEASLALWIDAPQTRPRERVPTDVSLVIDTSGSMAGAKIDNARRAAGLLIDDLANGDILSIVSFSDDARTLVEPTVLSREKRARLKAPSPSCNRQGRRTCSAASVSARLSSRELPHRTPSGALS
jgi:hypothetical protein